MFPKKGYFFPIAGLLLSSCVADRVFKPSADVVSPRRIFTRTGATASRSLAAA
jgi:hypothetical protein